jgi:hypothetical protein
LLAQAATAFADADAALTARDLATFDKKYREGVALVARAREGSAAAGDGAATPAPEQTTTTTAAPSSA